MAQPARIVRRVLAQWGPADPDMLEHDNFASYYTYMINHARKDLMESIHQQAKAVLRKPAA